MTATSDVIGLKPNSNGKTGIVYVRTTGRDETGDAVLDYVRWVMVRVGQESATLPDPVVPELKSAVPASDLMVPAPWHQVGSTGRSRAARWSATTTKSASASTMWTA